MSAEAKGKARSRKDQEMAARLKRLGVVRAIGNCAACYGTVRVDSAVSRYSHRCPGGKIR